MAQLCHPTEKKTGRLSKHDQNKKRRTTMLKRFLKFLKDDAVQTEINGTIFIKCQSVKAGLHRDMDVVPVYESHDTDHRYEKEESRKFPKTFSLKGYYIPQKNCYVTDRVMTGVTEKPETEKEYGINIYWDFDIQNKIQNEILQKVTAWCTENMDRIQPEKECREEDIKDIKQMFETGYTCIDVQKTAKKALDQIRLEINRMEFDTAEWLCENKYESDNAIKKYTDRMERAIAREKANNRMLMDMISKAENNCQENNSKQNRVRKLKSILRDMAEKGSATCNATFDFGYCTTVQKLKINAVLRTYNASDWINGTQTATRMFEKKYMQPASMKDDSIDEFLAYVTKIEARKTTVYEAESCAEHILENKLYNQISQSQEKDIRLEEFRNENPDCSIPFANGRDPLTKYVNGFYSSVDGVKFLIEHGANTKKLMNEIKLTQNNTQMVGTLYSSRDREEIQKYMMRIMTDNT